MKIAIDIDNTLSHTTRSFLEFLNKKYKKEKSIEDATNAWASKIYHVDFHKFFDDWEEFVESRAHEDMPAIEDSTDVIKKLSKDHELYVLTARPSTMKKETVFWIDKNYKDSFKETILLEYINKDDTTPLFSKYQVCEKLGASLIIEDDHKAAIDCFNKGMKVILYNHQETYHWQKKEVPKGIIKATSWKQIKKEIEKLSS